MSIEAALKGSESILPIQFRSLKESEINFVLNSWIKYWKNTKEFQDMFPNPRIYYEWSEPKIKKMLSRSKCIVAQDTEDPNHVFGYIVFEPKGSELYFHFLYVKKAFRSDKEKDGIKPRVGLRLIEKVFDSLNEKPEKVFHTTRANSIHWYKYKYSSDYNPLAR